RQPGQRDPASDRRPRLCGRGPATHAAGHADRDGRREPRGEHAQGSRGRPHAARQAVRCDACAQAADRHGVAGARDRRPGDGRVDATRDGFLMPHEPEKLFGGRLRTSTFVMLLVFAGVLVLYILVRPAKAQPTNTGNSTSTVQPRHKSSPTPSPSAKPTRTSNSPTPTSSVLISPSPSPSPSPS